MKKISNFQEILVSLSLSTILRFRNHEGLSQELFVNFIILYDCLDCFELSFLFGSGHSSPNVSLLFKKICHDIDSLCRVSQSIDFLFTLNYQMVGKLHPFIIFLLNSVFFLRCFHFMFTYPYIVLQLQICELFSFKILNNIVSTFYLIITFF